MLIDVFVADGQPLFLDALVRVVRQCRDLQLAGVAADGRTARDRIAALQPHVALLDVRLPGLPGDRVQRALERDGVPTAVILVSPSPRSEDAYQALVNGAAGTLAKDASADRFRESILTAARGGTVVADGELSGVVQEMRFRERSRGSVLTDREQVILRHIAAGKSTPAIAHELHVGSATVKTHVNHLYEKLGVNERAQAVAVGMRRGLLE